MRRKMAVIAMVTVAVVGGSNGQYFTPSVGVTFGGDEPVSHQIGATAGKQLGEKWGVELEIFGYSASDYEGVSGEIRIRPMVSGMVNATYSLNPAGMINPFLFVGVGAGEYEYFKEPVPMRDAGKKFIGYSDAVEKTEILATIQAGAGIAVDCTDITEGLYFEARAKTMLTDEYSFEGTDRDLSTVSMTVGIRIVR